MMPISCTECRRRKIKCNKLLPCNQCTVKGRTCDYPAKFRSIEIDHLVSEPTIQGSVSLPPSLEASRYPTDSPVAVTKQETSDDASLHEVSSSTTSSKRLRSLSTDSSAELLTKQLSRENEALKLKLRELKLKTKRQRTKLEQLSTNVQDFSDVDDNSDSNVSAKEETEQKELSEKEGKAENYYGPNSTRFMINSSLSTSDFVEFDNFIKYRKYQNRTLPQLLDPKLHPNKSKAVLSAENKEVIILLVKKFMHLKVHYVNYMHVDKLLGFLVAYDTEKAWNRGNDDKLMLTIMILIVTLRSIPQKDSTLVKYNLSYKKDRHSLYKQYRMLKSTIHHQSTTVLRAYVLECEDLFFNDRIEDSWDSLFLTVSMAYSLGLHVYDSSIAQTLEKEDLDKASDIIRSNDKTSLWFVINFISATLCSVLGRPNPVAFTFHPLLQNYEIRLNYKMALADLINRSTNILIDSYKVAIDEKLVLAIDKSFVNEAKIYEKILVDTRIMKNLESRDATRASFITLPVVDSVKRQHTRDTFKHSQFASSPLVADCPLDIRFTILRPCAFRAEEEHFCMILEDGDTLCDLILLYGNRAKFNQHFMMQYKQALESCIDSCKSVLDHGLDLIELLYRKTGEPRFHAIYPFFYVFLYQTFVVIYTMLHMNFNQLMPYATEIETIRNKLFKLYDSVGPKTWRPNVVKLIQAINEMCDKFFMKLINLVTSSEQTNDENAKGDQNPKVFGLTPFKEANEVPLKPNKSFTNSNNIKMYSIPESVQKQLQKTPDKPQLTSNRSNLNLPNIPSFSKMTMSYLNDLNTSANNNINTPIHDIGQISETPSFLKLVEMNRKNIDDSLDLSPGLLVPYNNMLNLEDPFYIQNPSNFQYGEKSPGSTNDSVNGSANGSATHDHPESV